MAKKKNQVLAEKKTEFIKTLLRENPYANPDEIMAKVVGAFPSGNPKKPGGVSKVLIAQVRWNDFGLRLGPGGRVFDKKGKWIANADKANAAKTVSEAKTSAIKPIDLDASQKRLQKLVTDLREEMAARNIERVDVPLKGHISTVRRVQEDLAI